MARFALALLLMAAFPAYPQQPVYRCVDANNRVSFSDKPGPGCQPTKPLPPPPKAEPKSAAKDSKDKGAKKVAKASRQETPAQRCARLTWQADDTPTKRRAQARAEAERACQ